MKKLYHNTLEYFYKLESRIAFYPTLLSLAGIIFAFLMIYIESKGISGYLVENAPFLVVNDTETARTLLTTFIAGLISIMVFSFSMVMILLNQASSNFSPRVLPGLISNSRHQIVLGIYNSTLFYCIFTLVSIEQDGDKYQLPGFSVLLGILGMSLCLCAFIYFIHSISQEIQVNNIMRRIFNTAKKRLVDLIEEQNQISTDFPETDKWAFLNSVESGYIQDVSIHTIAAIAEDENLKFEIIPVKGIYNLKGSPIIKYNGDINDEIKEKLLASFHYSQSELIEDNYVLAFKQLTEIAVKAMSPGINDPGTAINAIDYITELFLLRIKKNDNSFIYDDRGIANVSINAISFKDLIYNTMSSLRTYCKHDNIIVQKLMQMLSLLLKSETFARVDYKNSLKKEIDNLYEDATNSLKNSEDLNRLDLAYQNIKS